jgi:pre-mRNA-processing factor SLU7
LRWGWAYCVCPIHALPQSFGKQAFSVPEIFSDCITFLFLQRKSGALEPEKDADGNEINPHIPQYMSAAPWYLNTGLGLKHQKNYKDKTVAEGVAARSVAAIGKSKKVSGSRDEFGEKIGQSNAKTEMPRANGYDASYAGKRDRWNGYDPSSYLRVMKKHELLAKERQAIREANVDASLVEGGTKTDKKAKKKKDDDSSSSSDEEEEQEMDADKAEMLDRDGAVIGQQIDEGRVGMKTRVSVRNLRIREDTAKYLRNLDTSSAYYDPKTRSMRSNPNPEKDPNEVDFAGDNFIRYTGEAKSLASQQLYEFEAYERGQQVHMLAMPTQAENLHKTFEEKKNSLASKQKEDLMEKYGGRVILPPPRIPTLQLLPLPYVMRVAPTSQ